jgi:uncharacterized protein
VIWTAFLLGFLGSFHCLGMCGPIALAVSAKDNSKFLKNKIIYNLGRTTTYSLLGGVIGLVGLSFSLAGIQQWISILMGSIILIMAFFYKRSERWITHSGLFGGVSKLKSSLGYFLKKGGSTAFFASGVLNGLLPCGMVYIALIASLALQNPVHGALYMFFFGIGTIPMLVSIMITGKILSLSLRTKLTNFLPYVAMFIGILFIVRGLGLGIHYISPKLPSSEMDKVTTEMTVCD